jgi:tetratricopeptide (TPR) repeat protein
MTAGHNAIRGSGPDRKPAFEKSLGPDHADVTTTLNNLADLDREVGRYADAERLYKRSLAIQEKSLGSDHPDVAVTLNGLALLYEKTGRSADAKSLYKRLRSILEKTKVSIPTGQ